MFQDSAQSTPRVDFFSPEADIGDPSRRPPMYVLKQAIGVLIILGLALVAPAAFAQDETSAVAEVFVCTYVDGKGWSDVEQAAKVYNAGLKEVGGGLEEMRSFAWRPYRGNVSFDFLWSTNNANLNEMARTSMAYAASPQSGVSGALFGAVADCESGIMFQEVIFEAKEQADLSNGYLIESYVCSINPGKDMGDVRKALKTWKSNAEKIGTLGPVIMRTLQVGNFPFDLSYIVVHKDLAAYAAATTKYLTSKGAKSTQAALSKVQSCTSTLWRGQQMTP
jgi:hypothetical protein